MEIENPPDFRFYGTVAGMKTVFVGLSGGVDSAVSAALLKEQGYKVVGAYIKIWQPEFIECTWREDRLDAMRVAATLGIPFKEIDLSEEYKKEVVEHMVADYARGITPNPDVLCNSKIKFGSFAAWARENGADYVATGHYARIEEKDGQYRLLRGKDENKDQSYFLYQLEASDLARTLFPVGGFTKSEVRARAVQFDLLVAKKPDSQGLCFVGDVSMRDFLSRFIHLKNGPVVDMEGRHIGEHEGAGLYTVGQRHGFTVAHTGASQGAYFVVAVDAVHNTIQVSTRRFDAMRTEVRLPKIHWIGKTRTGSLEAHVQARYRESPQKAQIEMSGISARVRFSEPRIAASGQSLVIYKEDECLGGGVIMEE